MIGFVALTDMKHGIIENPISNSQIVWSMDDIRFCWIFDNVCQIFIRRSDLVLVMGNRQRWNRHTITDFAIPTKTKNAGCDFYFLFIFLPLFKISKVVKLKVTHFGTVDSHSYFVYIRRSCRPRFGNRVNMRSLRADWTTMLLFTSFYFISHILHYLFVCFFFFRVFWLGIVINIIVWPDWNYTWKILFPKATNTNKRKCKFTKKKSGKKR